MEKSNQRSLNSKVEIERRHLLGGKNQQNHCKAMNETSSSSPILSPPKGFGYDHDSRNTIDQSLKDRVSISTKDQKNPSVRTTKHLSTSSSEATSGFQRELQQAHKKWFRKHQTHGLTSNGYYSEDEKKDEEVHLSSLSHGGMPNSRTYDGSIGHHHQQQQQQRSVSPKFFVREEEDDMSHTSGLYDPYSHDNNTDDVIRNELQKACRMLDMEKVKNLALKDKLIDVENQLRATRESQSNEFVDQYTRQIRQLQAEVVQYRQLVNEERRKREDLTEKYNVLQQQNERFADKMNVLMFQHIPNHSPKFKDIGPVDFNVYESFGSVGNYKFGDIVGEGYYGSVRVGKSINLDEKYAIKVLNKDRIKRFKDLQQVAIEVHVMKYFRHPNIIHLKEVIHAGENIYIVTELCSLDLHQYHNDIGLTEDSAKQVILGVLRPLQHLHSHGICHLDLKPENILLTQTLDAHEIKHEHVRLCDFGLVNMAKAPTDPLVRVNYACGTPGFYAPEMILKNKFEGRRADMWSLGCIILEVTLGFSQEWVDSYDNAELDPAGFECGLNNTLRNITTSKYPLHGKLVDMLHSCLSIDDTCRITTAAALGHPWISDVSENNTIPSNASSPTSNDQKWDRIYRERNFILDSQASSFCV
jgi:hypothetical protein